MGIPCATCGLIDLIDKAKQNTALDAEIQSAIPLLFTAVIILIVCLVIQRTKRKQKIPVPVKPPYYHYQIKSGHNKGAFVSFPVTRATESFSEKVVDERLELIKAGHKVI